MYKKKNIYFLFQNVKIFIKKLNEIKIIKNKTKSTPGRDYKDIKKNG